MKTRHPRLSGSAHDSVTNFANALGSRAVCEAGSGLVMLPTV